MLVSFNKKNKLTLSIAAVMLLCCMCVVVVCKAEQWIHLQVIQI
jgi:hypothetical protein